MGIFSKLSTVIKSNINDLISKAENPEKMLNQIILDMRDQLAKAKREYERQTNLWEQQLISEETYTNRQKPPLLTTSFSPASSRVRYPSATGRT